MKITVLFTLLALIAVASCHQQLRRHEMPFLDSMDPLKMARVMSGDLTALLPSFLQPLASKIMGQQQSGTSSFLQKASSLFGGSSSNGGGMFGGMGDLFSKASGSSGSNGGGIFSQFTNAFGGSSSNSGSSSPLSGLTNLIGGNSNTNTNSGSGGIFSGILPSFGK